MNDNYAGKRKVKSQVTLSDIHDGRNGTGADFSPSCFVFTLLIIILPLFHARQPLALTKQHSVTTSGFKTLKPSGYYTVSQEERPIFWEVIVSVILSKKLYTRTYMCPTPKGFRDTAISL
jgi:hypothetical protein